MNTCTVVIPVRDGGFESGRCLESVVRADGVSRVIIVNDASGPKVASFLDFASKSSNRITVLTSTERQGYTRSVNWGIQESESDFVVTLNSDTVVPRNWITALSASFFHSTVGAVGPLSNAAGPQSVPRSRSNYAERLARQTPINKLRSGVTVEEVNLALQRAERADVWVPALHGFNMMIRRELFDQIGLFDEREFPIGYGEETDFCLRAVDAGWGLRLNRQVFVWHEKSASFSETERSGLLDSGRRALEARFGRHRLRVVSASLSNLNLPFREVAGFFE